MIEELVFDDLRHEAVNSLNGCLRAETSQHNNYGRKTTTMECRGRLRVTKKKMLACTTFFNL